MLVVQLLLPRFLVVEVVLIIHFMQGQACGPKTFKKKGTPTVSLEVEVEQKTCFVPVGNNTIEQEPLFFQPNGDFLLPIVKDKSSTVVPIKGQAVISCPSARLSQLGDGTKHVMNIQCLNSDFNLLTTSNNNNNIDFKDLSCSRSIRETVQPTQKRCGPAGKHGFLVHIGWKALLNRNLLMPQITLCHDNVIEHTYYTNPVSYTHLTLPTIYSV